MQWYSCPKCGKIHPKGYKCRAGELPTRKTDTDRLRSTSAWTRKALDIKERSHYLCAVCLEQGIYTYEGVEVHHITKLRDNPDGLLDDSNLICLCKAHHKLADEGKIPADHLRELARRRDEKK